MNIYFLALEVFIERGIGVGVDKSEKEVASYFLLSTLKMSLIIIYLVQRILNPNAT